MRDAEPMGEKLRAGATAQRAEPPPPAPASSAFARFVGSSAAALVAETVTLPTDVAKTRLQVDSAGRYSGMLHCMRSTASEEGVGALWKGLAPALIRQVCYSSLAMVLFEPIRDLMVAEGETPNFLQRLMAGGTAGAISISVFNPTEVIKTQLMTSGKGTPPSMATVARNVVKSDGVLGLWAGLRPNVARTFLVNAMELGTYDQAKSMLIDVIGDGPQAHIGASGIAGVASAVTSTPADVVKTRLMNDAGGQQRYTGMLHAGRCILREEGVGALYSGFTPIVIRKVIWCTVFFVTFEQIKAKVS